MTDLFDIDLLSNLLSVVDHRGFTAAAQAINSTQSTVSAKVSRLEEQAGHRLIERNKRGVVALTREGEIVERMAREILHIQQATIRQLSAPPIRGCVRIGMSDDFASGRGITPILGAFAQEYPMVCLETWIGSGPNLAKLVKQGRLDYALLKIDDQNSANAIELWREKLFWTESMTYPVAHQETIRLVTFTPPCNYRSSAIEALRKEDRPWHVVYVSPSLSGIRCAVTAGLGVTLLPKSLITDDMRLVEPGLLPLVGTVGFGLCTRSNIEDAAALLLGELLLSLQATN